MAGARHISGVNHCDFFKLQRLLQRLKVGAALNAQPKQSELLRLRCGDFTRRPGRHGGRAGASHLVAGHDMVSARS